MSFEFSHGDLGRPVRVVSLCFPGGSRTIEEIGRVMDLEGARGADVISLPETWRGQDEHTMEDLAGPTVQALAAMAKKHRTYIVAPIDRIDGARRLNTAVLIDRAGEVAGCYDKVFPYWSEYDHAHPVQPGADALVFAADFGQLGIAICFDANFPEVWQRLADQDAELVIWSSAYSAGTSLQAHAINHHYYVVSTTQTGDCQAYDITGRLLLDCCRAPVNAVRLCLDLDRGIYHQNFNIGPRDRLLRERGDDIAQELWLEREQWFVLKAGRPGVSARELARQYGLEELRAYIQRSRREIDHMRGRTFSADVAARRKETIP